MLKVPDDSIMLAEAALRINSASIRTGMLHGGLIPVTRKHCILMAARGSIGHDGFAQRIAEVQQIVPYSRVSEIVAMSSRFTTPESAALELVRLWRNSRSHWTALNGPCKFYAFSMGLWLGRAYGIGIFVK